MVPIPAGHGIRLSVRRILANYRAPSVLQEAIHLRQVGRGSAIRPGEEGDRRALDSSLSHQYTAPWSEVQASSSQARHSHRRPWSSTRSVARTLLAGVVRRRRSASSGASRSCVPPGSRPAYSGPSARSLSRRRRSATHACCTPLRVAPMPCAGRSSQRRTCRRGHWAAWMRARRQRSPPPPPPGVPALFWAEAHLPKQMFGPPSPGQVRRGQRQGCPCREGVHGNVRAGKGEEGLLNRRGPEGPSLAHVTRG